jgi:hypothetical protein
MLPIIPQDFALSQGKRKPNWFLISNETIIKSSILVGKTADLSMDVSYTYRLDRIKFGYTMTGQKLVLPMNWWKKVCLNPILF